MYMYWSRCQYEIILKDWPCGKIEEKWDIHKQIMMNIDIITNLLMKEFKKMKYYVAKDMSGFTYMYTKLPVQDEREWKAADEDTDVFEIDYRLFPNIDFSDDPIEVELNISNNEIN